MSSTEFQFLARLERFYRHYSPDNVPSATFTLQAYVGREEALFRALTKKYGPEPKNVEGEVTVAQLLVPVSETIPLPPGQLEYFDIHFDVFRRRLERIFTFYDPSSSSKIDTLLANYQGRDEVVFKLLEQEYGPEPRAFVDLRSTTGTVSSGQEMKALQFHTPWDVVQVLTNLKIRGDVIQRTLNFWGEGKRSYAASLALVYALVGDDQIFDPDPEKSLQLSQQRLEAAKVAAADLVDHFAFEHLVLFREIFASALKHASYLKSLELVERGWICEQFSNVVCKTSYRKVVLTEALRQVGPIEAERRNCIEDDERLNGEGIVTWFRQRRQTILHAATPTSPQGKMQSKFSLASHGDKISIKKWERGAVVTSSQAPIIKCNTAISPQLFSSSTEGHHSRLPQAVAHTEKLTSPSPNAPDNPLLRNKTYRCARMAPRGYFSTVNAIAGSPQSTLLRQPDRGHSGLYH